MVKLEKKINVVILDFVKTLVEEKLPWDQLREETSKIFRNYAINLQPNHLRPIIEQTASQLQFLANLKYSSETILKIEGEILAAQQVFEKKYLKLFNPFEDTLPFIKKANMHNLKVGILTNNFSSTVTQVFLRYKIPFHGQIVGRGDIKYPKPNSEGLIKLLSKLNANPKEAVVIGDSDFDIDVAKQINTHAIFIKRNAEFRLSYAKPDQTINSLSDITMDN